jgi:cysteine-rich repeat protein
MLRALLIVVFLARTAAAVLLADSMSVSGDSISRGFDANTSSCNYGDNVSRNWATGDDHGSNFCGSGGVTFSHAERLECAKGGNITNFNDSASGADMLSDFFNQAQQIKLNLTAAPGPHYIPVFMGHNDICTNTTSKTGNSCSGDDDPNNYCRTTNAAFEREFRRGMDQLIQIPSSRIGVSALVRVSELCNFTGKSGCGLIFFGDCQDVWGLVDICASLTVDCSNQRRIDAYNTALGYNEILERVTNEYIAIPNGGISATGAPKAPDVQIRYSEGAFNFRFGSSDVSCCDCFHPSDIGQSKIAEFGWNGLQCSASTPCCATSGDPLIDAKCDALDTTTFYPSGFWPGGMPCGNGIIDPGEQCDDGNTFDGDCCSSSCLYEAPGIGCTSDGNPCTNDVCNATGICIHPTNTAPCDDGQFCTVNDTCGGGACGGTPRDCSLATDQCNLGVCNEVSDLCVPQPVANGAPCTDGDACTQTDTCQGGACSGTNPVVCTALDQCHDVGTCNPLSGTCSNPPKPDGSACTDGNACTQTDTCAGGVCGGANPVVCTALDQCHDAGTCDTGTGVCSNPSKPDGTTCTDGDACTQTDACTGGTCTGTNPVVCTALDQCHDAGTCDTGTGTCPTPVKPDGSACDDGDACTVGDACTAGACGGGPACGDGVVQAGCGEGCDDGPGNGSNGCCSASCTLVDADGDALCDALDPCTNGAALTLTSVKIGRLTTLPGDDSLSWKGEVILPHPFSPTLDPAANGIRLLLAQGTTSVLDVVIPGGPRAGSPPVGWRMSGNGAKWSYVNASPTPAGGIAKVLVQHAASTPGRLKLRIKGKNASLAVAPNDPSLTAVVVLDPPVATTGQCGEATLACTTSGSGSTRRCQ